MALNDYTDNILSIIGGGHVGSGYRTQAEQDALRARGVTKTVHSSHTTGTPEEPGAVDVSGNPLSPEAAAAALHAHGFPNAAVINETGVGPNQGTGPHKHITLDSSLPRTNAGGASPPASVASPPIPAVLREQGSTELPTTPGPATIVNPFDMASGQLPADLNTANDRARAADKMLQDVITTQAPANEAARAASLQTRNDTIAAVNNDITDRTQSFLGKVKPLFQQKEAVADQYRKVTDMNPLERGFMSLFDPSYDKDHLRAVDQAIGNQLDTYGQDYHTILDAQSTLLKVADSSYQGDEMMNLLQRGFMDEKLDLASKSFASADTIISSSMKALGAQSQLLAAQNQLQDQVITSLTPGQRATALTAAQKNPDKSVTIQGARFTEGQLLSASQADAKQQVALDEMVLSRETAKMNNSMTAQRMADQAEDKLIGSLTTAQTRQAIQDGGVWQGHQLNLDKLGGGLQAGMARDALMVNGTLQQGSTQTLATSIKSMSNQMQLGHQRIMQLTGIAPPEVVRSWGMISQEIQQITQKITSAPPEQRDALSQQYSQRVQELYSAQQKTVDSVAQRWAGGNKKLLPLAQAFLAGAPLNSTSAVQGLIEMARTNGSFGGGMSESATAALAVAKRMVQDDATPKSGISVEAAMAGPQSKAEKEQALEARVSRAISDTYQNTIFQRVTQSAPQIAKQIGHLGQNLDPDILNQAISAGDDKGFEVISAQLNITPAQAKVLFHSGDESSPIWQHANHKDAKGNEVTFNQYQSQLQVAQLQNTYRILDAAHPKIGKYSAGAVYANLLGNQRFAQVAGNMAQAQGQASFGDSIMNAMGGSSIQGQVAQYGQMAMGAYNAMGKRDLLMRVAQSNRYGNDPIARAHTIIGAIPGINPHERDQLVSGIKSVLATMPPNVNPVAMGAGDIGDVQGVGNAAASYDIAQIVKGHKFQDPNLERIRKHAAAKYDELSKITDDAVDSLGTYKP